MKTINQFLYIKRSFQGRIILLFLLLGFQLPSLAVNYYWVGGSGIYSDINHWATTSGGTIKYTLPPTASDDVFFDANSGFTSNSRTVTLDVNSFSRNMSWQGALNNPVFTAPSGGRILEIWGSWYLNPGMSMSNVFPYMKSTQPGQTITTNGVGMGYITFDGAGAWKLMDAFISTGSITFTSGNLDFNGNQVKCAAFSSGSSAARTLNIAGSEITIATGGWSYTGTGSNVLTNAQTANSLIILNDGSLTAKNGDKYYNVDLYSKSATLSVNAGTFNKIRYLSGYGVLSNFTSVTTDSLIVSSPGGQITFTRPTTVNKYLLMAPSTSCGSILDILGGTINMVGAAEVYVNNARLKSTIITGLGTPYSALSSIDLGGNTGWSIQAMTGNTYYWVGGTGNWTDQNHWANASGGTGGSGCIPTPLDNVVFDNNSGFTSVSKTVTLNNGVAYCNDMSWLGTVTPPTLSYSTMTQPLEVHGSLYLQRGMNFNAYILNMYTELPNRTITTNGATINPPIFFKSDNNTGGWNFQDSLKNASYITFYSGNLNFNEQYVYLASAFTSTGTTTAPYNNNRTLNIANSIIDAAYWNYSGGIPLDQAHSVNSLIRLTNTPMVSKAGDYYYNLELQYPTGTTAISNGTYNRITFTSTATTASFTGKITTDSLEFKNSGNYTFFNDISVNKYLATKTSCGGITTLASDITTERTIVMGDPSEVRVSSLQINYVSITGPGVPYSAINSIKGSGIDAGWNFGAIISNTFYWVGGAGNWNDQNHWAITSGGAPGSGCIPSPFDNVIFDINSFSSSGQTVTVNAPAYCDSMSWIGSTAQRPVLMLSSTILQVNGSLLFQQGMTTSSSGTAGISMNSKRPGEKITSNGVRMNYYLYFDGPGEWLLQDPLAFVNGIYFNNGNLNFNGQPALMNYFFGNAGGNTGRMFNIANSVITVGNTWNSSGGLPLTADRTANSVISMTSSSSSNFTAKTTDVYNVLEFPITNTSGSANVNQGIFKRISIAKLNNGAFSSIVTDTLSLGPGGTTNTFQTNATSIVNKLLLPNGTPCLPTTIQSTSNGTRANLSMPKTAANVLPDTILLEFIRLRDINAVAGADRAKMKKGPQSIDNAGYGASGNNNNWTIAPYIGAAGFDGLGPDLSFGCTDFPQTIHLDPVYLVGADGSYEWRLNSPTGTIIGTTPKLSISTPGNYYLKVNYDLGKTCNLTDSKDIVSNADSLIWTGLAGNSDWNNSLNWRKADGTTNMTTIPRACTDVLIPAGTTTYPILNIANTSRSVYPNVECRNIHFASGGETSYTDSLYYSKAYVDLKMAQSKWFMLSSSLQNTYSGDYWLAPLDVQPSNPANYNRHSPKVYMQMYQTVNPQTGEYNGNSTGNWSKPFNTLDVSLRLGMGYVSAIDAGALTDSSTFHFPRLETTYEYFTITGVRTGIYTGTLTRNSSNRLHIEPGFNGIIPINWDSISKSTLILGNPMMSHLDFTKFLADAGNSSKVNPTYYIWSGSSFDAFTGDGSINTGNWTENTQLIAPMQSFIIQKKNPSDNITSLNLNSGMSAILPGDVLKNTKDNPSLLTLEVFRDNFRQSGITLIPDQEGILNVPTFFSENVKQPAIIYFGNSINPYSIVYGIGTKYLEIGLRTTVMGALTFKLNTNTHYPNGSQVILEDRLLGTTQNLLELPSYTFTNTTGNIQSRFYLKVSKNITGIITPKVDDIHIYISDHSIHITSNNDLESVEVFNLQGQLIYKRNGLGGHDYSFGLNIANQMVIVKVISSIGSKTEKIKL